MSLTSRSSESSEIRLDDRRLEQDIAAPVAAEHRRQVEAEPVDATLDDPVPQALEQIVAHERAVARERIAAAAKVQVAALVIEHVVKSIVDARESSGGPAFASFGGVIEDDVENRPRFPPNERHRPFRRIRARGHTAPGCWRKPPWVRRTGWGCSPRSSEASRR